MSILWTLACKIIRAQGAAQSAAITNQIYFTHDHRFHDRSSLSRPSTRVLNRCCKVNEMLCLCSLICALLVNHLQKCPHPSRCFGTVHPLEIHPWCILGLFIIVSPALCIKYFVLFRFSLFIFGILVTHKNVFEQSTIVNHIHFKIRVLLYFLCIYLSL